MFRKMSEINTQQKIKEAARDVFTKKGMAGARMQEIADQAGINKALLHYYYRSKEKLFNEVFEETLAQFIPQLFGVLNSELPLETKVYQVSEKYIDFLIENPALPMFVLNEIHSHPARLAKKMNASRSHFDTIEKQLKEEALKGNIVPISVEMFMMNILSLLVFPFLSGKLLQAAMSIKDEQMAAIYEKRKSEVPRFIMNAIAP